MFNKTCKVVGLLAIIGFCICYIVHILKDDGSSERTKLQKKMAFSRQLAVANSGNSDKTNKTNPSDPVARDSEKGPFSTWQITLENFPSKDKSGCTISGMLFFSDGKIKPINVKLYRGLHRDGDFKLVKEQLFKGDEKSFSNQNNNAQGGIRINFKDVMEASESGNCIYYKMEVFLQNGKLLKAFPPAKTFFISKLDISEKGWSWSPYPNGEKIENGCISEIIKLKDNETVIVSAHDLKEAVSGEFPDSPRKFSMSLKFKFPRNECWRSEPPSLPEQDMTLLDLKLFAASPDEVPAKFVIPHFSDSERRIAYNLSRRMNFQKLLVDGKESPVNPEMDSFNIYFIGSPKITLTYAILDHSIIPPLIIKKDTIEFRYPPNPPVPKIVSDENGISLSWEDCAIRFDPKDFMTLPKIGIYRYDGRDDKLIKTCELGETSFTDKDEALVYGNEYGYHLAFRDCIMKTQGYVEGLKSKDFYVNIDTLERPFTNRGNRGYKVFCRSNKGNSSPVAMKSKISQKPPRIPMEGPLTVGLGLLRGEMCHEGTGVLEVSLYTKVVNALLKENDIEVMDRVNSDKILKEMSEKLPQNMRKRFWLKDPDFVVRIRDYSDETGNGVELWLTRLTDYYGDPASVQTWRIGRISLKDSAEAEYDQLTSSLVSKIRAVAASTFNIPIPARKTELSPKNIIFTPFLPTVQPDPISQYKSVSESIVLGASDSLSEQNILSANDWSIRSRERILLENSGVSLPPDSFADLLISGRMWKEKDKISYLFLATDLLTTRVVGSLCLSGKIDDVAPAMGKWCSSLKICKPVKDVPVADQMNIDYEKLRITRVEKSMEEKVKSPDGAPSNNKSPLSLATEVAQAGDFMMAINILEQAWSEKQDNAVGERLATYYFSAGMYALSAELLGELSKRGVNINAETLNRAKSLASNSSALVAADSAARKKGIETVFAVSPTTKNIDDATKFTTRDYKEEEWFISIPDDPLVTGKIKEDIYVNSILGMPLRKILGIKKYPNVMIPLNETKSYVSVEDGKIPIRNVTTIEYLGLCLSEDYMNFVRSYKNNERNKNTLKIKHLLAADILAKNNVENGKMVVNEAMSQDLDKIASALDKTKESKSVYDNVDLVVYRAYAGDEKALAYLSDQKWIRKNFWDSVDFSEDINNISLYLMAEAGREDALAALMSALSKSSRYKLRNVNSEFMKKFIVRHPSLFEPYERARLFDGYGLKDQAMMLIDIPDRQNIPYAQLNGIILLQGRPFRETIEDMEGKYYADKK